jgi:hypothetical protein
MAWIAVQQPESTFAHLFSQRANSREVCHIQELRLVSIAGRWQEDNLKRVSEYFPMGLGCFRSGLK